MIVEGLYTAVYMPGDLIMRKGDPSDWMGFIGTGGEVSIVDPDEKGRTFTKTLAEGDYLGEIGLLYDTRRTMDVEAVGHCRIHVLSRSTLDRMRRRLKETLSLINSIKSDVELKKRLSIEEIAALKKDTIVADIRKKMLASVVQDQSYAAESKRQKRASGHAGKRGDESKEPTTDPVPARSLDEKTVADLAADAAAAFD
ncbi:voltage-gated potassium channel [Aureococcus anophagefferens]|nr:voltage-gated potassium channel [Aureococcus anophagefferens]